MISGRSGFIGDGAKRFEGPFVTTAAEPDEDAARVEQLRGHTADHLFKHNRRGSADQTFSRGSVSAEMAIRSASTGTSTTLGFTNQRDGGFSNTLNAGLEMQRRRSPAKPDGLGGRCWTSWEILFDGQKFVRQSSRLTLQVSAFRKPSRLPRL